ncbi:MAG: CidA/LrgA family protein [Parvibaculales bacterium]
MLHWLTQTPIPAGIYGLLILFFGLQILGRVPEPVRLAGDFLITHMPLFFLPAAVSLLGYGNLLEGQGAGLVLALGLSTVIALIASAGLLQRLLARQTNRGDAHD